MGNHHVKLSNIERIFSTQGFQLSDCSINIVLNFDFIQDIAIWRKACCTWLNLAVLT